MFDESLRDDFRLYQGMPDEEFFRLFPHTAPGGGVQQPGQPGSGVTQPQQGPMPDPGALFNPPSEWTQPQPVPPPNYFDQSRPWQHAGAGGGLLPAGLNMQADSGVGEDEGWGGLLGGQKNGWGPALMALGGGIAAGSAFGGGGWGGGIGKGLMGAAGIMQRQRELDSEEERYNKALRLKEAEADRGEIKEVNGRFFRVSANGVTPIDTGPAPVDFKSAKDLRSEYTSSPDYKTFQAALPTWKSMVDTAGRNTRASDVNLVYGLAKIMDPNSVVREGEMIIVNDTNSLPDWLKGQINRLNGGSSLSKTTRKGILTEARSRMDAYRQSAESSQKHILGIADKFQIPHDYIASPLDELAAIPDLGEDVAPGTGSKLGPAPDASTAAPGTPTVDAGIVPGANSSQIPRVNSAAEASRLPRGTKFYDPNGVLREVP